MKTGITHLSLLPLRLEPSHRSEMVSQLLFGECYEVKEEQKDWLRIECRHDGYTGWIDAAQFQEISEKEASKYTPDNTATLLDLLCMVSSPARSLAITAGASLPLYDGMNFTLGREKYVLNAQAVVPGNNYHLLEKLALRYLETPYLWGGRSPLGIDCSGFTQIIFKYLGVALPRDAYQQADCGTALNFVEESRPGDLAFFANDEGRITHVGLVLEGQRIIHSSGKVRMDRLDHFGIFNASLNKYSHTLKVIKRLGI